VAITITFMKFAPCGFNDAVPYTQSSSGDLCWMAFPYGLILMLQKYPEGESVRDQQ
jgi:hypothetical protein